MVVDCICLQQHLESRYNSCVFLYEGKLETALVEQENLNTQILRADLSRRIIASPSEVPRVSHDKQM